MNKYKLSTVLAHTGSKNNIWDSCCWLPIVMVINCAFIERIGVGIYSLLRLFSDSQMIWVHPAHQHGRRPGHSLGQSFLLTTIMVAKNTVASFGNQSPKSVINESFISLNRCVCGLTLLHSYAGPERQWTVHTIEFMFSVTWSSRQDMTVLSHILLFLLS